MKQLLLLENSSIVARRVSGGIAGRPCAPAPSRTALQTPSFFPPEQNLFCGRGCTVTAQGVGQRRPYSPDHKAKSYAPANCAGVSSLSSGRPLANRSTFREKISHNRCLNFGLRLEPEMCGVKMTFGNRHKG